MSKSSLVSFDPWVDAYDRARPGYPPELYDALERATRPLAGATVVEGGAGTGLATAALTARGAEVVAVDVGAKMLVRLARRAPQAKRVVADANRLPLADGAADLICFAQSWHWLDLSGPAQAEAARVLTLDGWWAGWWSHPRGDGLAWFDAYQDELEGACPSYERTQRDVDWGATLTTGEHFAPAATTTVAWQRQLPIDDWLTDEQSKSYVGALDDDERDRLLDRLEGILRREFADGHVTCPYATWLWVAQRR
jgi:SAM-dependent methyltransferase